MDEVQTEVLMKLAYTAHGQVAPEGTLATWQVLYGPAHYETTWEAMIEMLRAPGSYIPKPGDVMSRAREIRIGRAARERAAREIAARRVAHAPWEVATSFHKAISGALKGVPLEARADVAEAACRAWLNERTVVTR